MKNLVRNRIVALALLAFSTLTLPLSPAHAQGTAFSYQGQLQNNGNPASGTYNLQFSLYTNSTGGSAVAGPVTTNGVVITNGLFTVTIDFGAAVWNGATNWLLIGVETNHGSSFNALTPRQQLTPAPYAIYAESGNAANLTGTVPDALLPSDVALTDASQTFTGANTFAGTGESFIINDSTAISTSLFTGLGLQYYFASGEGAIMSSFNDGDGFLSFYTKQGHGYPIAKQMIIDYYGGVAIDQQGVNSGIINNGTTNGVGLTFGISSGEGIASQRVPSATADNQYGLDFYTDFGRRMAISQGGLVGINVGTNKPTTQLEVNGPVRIDNNPLYLIAATTGSFADDGLVFGSGSLPGINVGGDGPFLAGYEGGALGALNPNTICLSWDAFGDVAVSNRLTAASLSAASLGINTLSPAQAVEVNGNYIQIDGAGAFDGDGPIDAYIGGNGSGSDVQVGSFNSQIGNVAFYNWGNNTYMHIYCSQITIEGGSDLAEPFKISPDHGAIPAGAVVVIDDQNPGRLKLSDCPYDTRVAGVVSGANGINPGIQMHQQGLVEGGQNVALSGRVYVQADASNGAIRPGDMLTTSSNPGYAMKVTDHSRAEGAILGKAMSGLADGKGMVLVLVTLQ